MDRFEQVEVSSRAELRNWLSANYEQKDSIWLVTYKKVVPEKYVSYDDIVEEVICFGWIDSRISKLDAERSMLLISPRKRTSKWSKVNKDRVEKLEKLGLLLPPGIAKIEQAKRDGTWNALDEVESLSLPDDLVARLEAEPPARANFDAFPRSAKRGILEWILNAKGAETRQKRVQLTAIMAAENLRANFPGEKEKLKRRL
ncbi:Bacteriocin-protection, YdeI or OmpD-Associated [Fimbriimonadaceae bacterium]